MPVLRLQCSWQKDTAFARDAVMINPVFNDQAGSEDADGLCEDLATALKTWDTDTTQLTVKAYDVQGTPPVLPIGSAVRNAGSFESSGAPREVALCLSYYSGNNVPRRRGRLFIPAVCFTGSVSGRPSPAQQTKVGELAAIFADLGGVDVDWSVYSPTTNTAHAVTNWWVDDEWDTIRSRGMRATSRITGTTTEAG